MRLQLTFLGLLIVASTATSLVWRESSPAAEGGNLIPAAIVLASAPIAVLSITLLGRMVVKARAGRSSKR